MPNAKPPATNLTPTNRLKTNSPTPRKPNNVTMDRKHNDFSRPTYKTDDDSDRDGDDLICGFGTRRRPTDASGDSTIDFVDRSDFVNERKKLASSAASGSGDNTLICGFGGDGGSCSSADIGEDSMEGMRHWVFEGELPGMEKDSNGDANKQLNGDADDNILSALVGNILEQHPGVDDDYAAAQEEEVEEVAPPTPPEENEAFHVKAVTTYSVSTKLDDGDTSRRPVRRRSSRGVLDRSESSASCDDMSMASEDAVVLMYGEMFGNNGSGDAPQDQEPKKPEICGRIYRHVPNLDFTSIPTELEIGSDMSHARSHSANYEFHSSRSNSTFDFSQAQSKNINFQMPQSHNNNNNFQAPIPKSLEVIETKNAKEPNLSPHGPPKSIMTVGQRNDLTNSTTSKSTISDPVSVAAGSTLQMPKSYYNVTSNRKSQTRPQSPPSFGNAAPNNKPSTRSQSPPPFGNSIPKKKAFTPQFESPKFEMPTETAESDEDAENEDSEGEDDKQIPEKKAPQESFPRPKQIKVATDNESDLDSDMLEAFIVEEGKYGRLSTELEINQKRRSSDLEIIEEGSRDSQSESMVKDPSMTSREETDSDYAFDEDEFDAGIDPEIDMLEAIASSRKKAVTGQHAKSMAKEFKKEAPVVKTLSQRMASEEDEASEKDEGRAAIVSRHIDQDYVKKVVHKAEPVRKLIRDEIAKNILFKNCSNEELEDLVDVFDYKEASAGSIIIRQGDDGDAFYVMEQGIVDVAVDGIHKVSLSGVISFGEIALMYGCPRSATIRARQFCKLWYIGRTAFRAITSQYKRKHLEAKIDSLKKVKIKGKPFQDILGQSEIETLALAAITETYPKGHVIIKEGDPGDIFYMIESGNVEVYIEKLGDKPVVTLTNGQFFGEMALLNNDPRAASCIASTDVKCHILMRNDFILLLGDLESLMKTNYRKRLSTSDNEDETIDDLLQKKPQLEIEIEDLDLIKVLGIGAFGRVQLAQLKKPIDGLKSDDGYFALKCISKQSLKESGLEAHMHSEKNIMASLDHPFINRFYCEMEDEKHLYFLLEALTGGELCKRLREEKKFPESWGKFYSASVLFAFCHMHAMKIAYRDLKPENLVMDSVGYVKVVDFGLAKVVEGGKTWTLCGTPAYLAPEIVLNDGHDWGVDYWAFGVFLFEMTSGKEPFRSKNPMEVYKQIVSGHVDIPSYFSANLADLIRKLLNISKSKRLGRTMGGGGAVMQHRWYSGFDWDAHLEKRLKAPLHPKTESLLRLESTGNSSVKSDRQNDSASSKRTTASSQRGTKMRISYSLGQGNRHHQKLMEMMGGDPKEPQQHDAVRMSMLRVIKQNERWSKASDASDGNDSTRNTSLGVGDVARSYIEEESSVGSDAMSMDNQDVVLRMQLMNMSLPSTKRDSQSKERCRAFQQFSLLGINPLSIQEGNVYATGSRFLDPFSTKNIILLDQFPTTVDSSVIDSEALAAFCFSNGLSLRLIPKCAVESAKRMGWLGEAGDQYQLQGFTDFAGSLSHGIAITISEQLDAQEVIRLLRFQRERRRSIAIIARWITKRLFRASCNFRNSTAKPRRRERRATDGLGSIRGAVDKMLLRTRMNSVRDNAGSVSSGLTYESGDDASIDISEQIQSRFSENIRRLGRIAYQAMIDVEREGEICIAQKSYVITGTPLNDQSLFFCGLQNLINMERLMKEKASTMKNSQRRNMFDNGDENKQSENRHAVLSALQSQLLLDPSQKRVCYPRSEMSHVQTPQRRFVMNLALPGFDDISLPLPLPMISGEWGIATLFLRIKDSGVMILLKLLLLERSVLVVGSNTEEVTSCATALLEMLNPYKWASAFMPLLPGEMLDFVSSPVPFIAGTIVENTKCLQDLIHDSGVREAMLNGLSIVNLVTGKLIVTRERGTSDMLRRSFQAIPELTLYQRRLEYYSKLPSSNLRSFQSFFKHGASRKESLTLSKIRGVIKKNLSQYTAGLNDRSDAWQQYGEFNEAIGTFDFCPDKFIQPLKDRMIFQIQFQEMMAHTQLFVGYVEDIKGAYEKRNKLLSGPSAKFIVQWIEECWCRKHDSERL